MWWHYLGQLLCMWYINIELLGGFGYEVDLFGTTQFITRQGFALLALIPIWLYRGKQGYHNKILQYGYYVFYPLHLLILGVLKFLSIPICRTDDTFSFIRIVMTKRWTNND